MLSRGIRNNNPFNIIFNPRAFVRDPWVGEEGIEEHARPRFSVFDIPEHGIRAGVKILLRYYRHYKLFTAQAIIDRFAPPIENDTNAYADAVAAYLYIETDEHIDLEDKDKMLQLTKAMIRHENGDQPYSDETIETAMELAYA
jgi:hypothetical protein